MDINGYKIIDKLTTDNSGTAKWGFAEKNGETVFIKEFLTPVYPYDKNSFLPAMIKSMKSICENFEKSKNKLYNSLRECRNGGVISPIDFFRNKSKYYIVTPKVDMSSIKPESIAQLDLNSRLIVCRVIAYNMMSIHAQKIVHADIKPDNILIKRTITGTYTAKIIDFDSSFFETDLPEPDDLQCDTVYMSPECFLYMCEAVDSISVKSDIFSLGILFCHYITGAAPDFDTEKYTYLYAAVLDETDICIKADIPENLKSLLLRMLSKDPENRPTIEEVFQNLTLNKPTLGFVSETDIEPETKVKDKPASIAKKKGFASAHKSL